MSKKFPHSAQPANIIPSSELSQLMRAEENLEASDSTLHHSSSITQPAYSPLTQHGQSEDDSSMQITNDESQLSRNSKPITTNHMNFIISLLTNNCILSPF